jgi:hypothetical protein
VNAVTLKRNAVKPVLVQFVVCLLAAIVIAVVSGSTLRAQAAPTSSSATAQATPSPSDTPPAQQTRPAKSDGMVWVNTDAGVYHKPGTRWYGKTKHGKYMLEADAIKAGYKPAEKRREEK